MTIEDKKEFGVVVSIVVSVVIALIVSLLNNFNIYDLGYLVVCIVFLARYSYLKLKK